MCSKKIRDWLELLTMEKYLHSFVERGYVTISHCQQIISSDLVMLGIDDPSHRKLLLHGVQLLINSPKLFACHEPCELHTPEPRSEPEPLENNYWTTDWSKSVSKLSLGFFKDELNTSFARGWKLMPFKDDQKQINSLTVNLKARFSCVACPHLKFEQLYDLDAHIAHLKDINDPSAAKHRPATVISKTQKSKPVAVTE